MRVPVLPSLVPLGAMLSSELYKLRRGFWKFNTSPIAAVPWCHSVCWKFAGRTVFSCPVTPLSVAFGMEVVLDFFSLPHRGCCAAAQSGVPMAPVLFSLQHTGMLGAGNAPFKP